MANEEIKKLLETEDYKFLKENKYLGNNICLLTLGGSRAYGTNLPSSDVDVRGVAINTLSEFFRTANDWEQVVDTATDTTVYSLSKMCKLLFNCNPNSIEIFGCRPEDYLFTNEYGKMLLDNKENFLSIRAIESFGGYANAQYNRLEHGLLGNGENDDKQLNMLKHSLECSLASFNAMHKSLPCNLGISIIEDDEFVKMMEERRIREKENLKAKLELDLKNAEGNESKTTSLNDLYRNDLAKIDVRIDEKIQNKDNQVDDRIILTGNLLDYPIGEVQSLLRELNTIKGTYGNINKRNTKKTDAKLCKHMMHLIRLYLMGIDLNTKRQIITYRKDEHDMLMSIRNGEYMYEDGKRVRPEFYELLHDIQAKYDYSVANTILPQEPNYEAIDEMMLSIYKSLIRGED